MNWIATQKNNDPNWNAPNKREWKYEEWKDCHTEKQNSCFVRSLTLLPQWLEGERKLPLQSASWFYIIVTGVGGLNTNKKM